MQSDRVVILGLGGAGGHVLSYLAERALPEQVTLVVADTDRQALDRIQEVRCVAMGREWTDDQGTGGDATVGERAASSCSDELSAVLSDARLVLVVAGLGGGTGSGSARVVARLMQEERGMVVFLVTLPFSCEGHWRRQQAELALGGLREVAHSVVAVQNDLIFSTLAADTAAQEAFPLADQVLADCVSGLSRLACARAQIPVDFANLRAVLKQGRPICTLGVGRGSGETRVRDAVDAFLACPLAGGPASIRSADSAVLNLIGGPDLSVREMQECLGGIQHQFPVSARVLCGAYTDEGMEGQVLVTGILCKYGNAGRAAALGRKRPKAKGKRDRAGTPVQDELPLQEQNLGIFARSSPTTYHGENLDIPTFQRLGVRLDTGTTAGDEDEEAD